MPSDFLALGIREQLNEALRQYGVAQPTPVQAQAIPALLDGSDVIAQAQTGTGKTLAFVLPILERIDLNKPFIQALVITPTRELALQITTEVKKLAGAVGVKVLAAYGGQDVERQIKKLQGSVHMVIGTPGRLLDHVRRDTIRLSGVSMLVLDEADQMLHMGFLNEVQDLIMQTNPKRQTMLFSATMPQPIRELAERFMDKPKDVRVEGKRITLDEIQQIAVETTDRGKQDTLIRMIEHYHPYLAIIFCRTKRRAKALNEALIEQGYDSDELHGDLSQAKREQVMKRFREAKLQLLVATDVAARGLDVEGVTHVFNYDIPQDAESYIHRIGRTGRAGQRGLAVTLVSPRDRMALADIERGINGSISKRSADGRKLTDSGYHRTRKGTTGGGQARSAHGDGNQRGNRDADPSRGSKSFQRGGADRKGRGSKQDEQRPSRKNNAKTGRSDKRAGTTARQGRAQEGRRSDRGRSNRQSRGRK